MFNAVHYLAGPSDIFVLKRFRILSVSCCVLQFFFARNTNARAKIFWGRRFRGVFVRIIFVRRRCSNLARLGRACGIRTDNTNRGTVRLCGMRSRYVRTATARTCVYACNERMYVFRYTYAGCFVCMYVQCPPDKSGHLRFLTSKFSV